MRSTLIVAASIIGLTALSSSAESLETAIGIPASQEMGSCNQRAILRLCTDLPRDPEARYLCVKNAGIWSSAPCAPPDLGSCKVGPQRTLRYYGGAPDESPHAARIRCESLQGVWTAAPSVEQPAQPTHPPGLFPEPPQEFRNATHPFRPGRQ